MGHEVWKVEVEVQMNEIGITDQRTTMEGNYDQRTQGGEDKELWNEDAIEYVSHMFEIDKEIHANMEQP